MNALRCRRAASRRLAILDSNRSDPWWYEPPGERGYEDAAVHLLSLGLLPAPNIAALRAMRRRGGDAQRVADIIAAAWELTG
jgi:hypothetical protein